MTESEESPRGPKRGETIGERAARLAAEGSNPNLNGIAQEAPSLPLSDGLARGQDLADARNRQGDQAALEQLAQELVLPIRSDPSPALLEGQRLADIRNRKGLDAVREEIRRSLEKPKK